MFAGFALLVVESWLAEGVFGLFFASLVHASELVGIILVWRFLTIYLGMLIGVPVTLHELARRRMGNG